MELFKFWAKNKAFLLGKLLIDCKIRNFFIFKLLLDIRFSFIKIFLEFVRKIVIYLKKKSIIFCSSKNDIVNFRREKSIIFRGLGLVQSLSSSVFHFLCEVNKISRLVLLGLILNNFWSKIELKMVIRVNWLIVSKMPANTCPFSSWNKLGSFQLWKLF